MRHEPGDGEAVVCSLLGLYGHMLTDSTGVEPYGGKTKGLRAKGEPTAQEEALCTSAPHAHADSSFKRAKTRPALAPLKCYGGADLHRHRDSVVRRDCSMSKK